MKKTLTRFLSMLLVLVMLLGVMPMALADDPSGGDGNVGGEITDPDDSVIPTGGSVTVLPASANLTLANGMASTTVTATAAAPTGYEVTSYAWTGATGNGSSVSFVSTAAGTYTVSVTVTCTKQAGADAALPPTTTLTNSTTIVVAAEELVLESVTITGDDEVEVGGTLRLSYTTTPADYVPKDVDWYVSSNTDEISVNDAGVVTGLKEGDALVFLDVDGKIDSFPVSVVEATTKVSVTDEIIVAVGETADIEVTFDPEDAGKDADIEFTSLDTDVATVGKTSGRVTGREEGTTRIKVRVENVDNFEDDTLYVDVIVTGDDLTCDVETTKASTSAKTLTLKPDYDGKVDDVTFKFSKVSSTSSVGTISINSTTGVVTATGAAAIRVKVEAVDKDGDTVATCYTGASFYKETDVEVTMPDDNVTLSFSTAKDIKESGNLLTKMLADYVGSATSTDRVYFDNLSAEEGSISGISTTTPYTTVANLGNRTFTVGTKGEAKFNYNIVMGAYEDLPLVKGTVEIAYDGKLDGITYTGTYDKSITVKESDFKEFWDDNDMDGTLEYIKITKLPSSSTEGTLYTSTTQTSSYKASTTHEFWYGTFTSSTTKKDLGALTFAPLATKKTEYTVYVPFTAYGDNKGKTETLNGYIIFKMNEPANDITSRGVFFGTEYDTKNDLTYADQIAEAYDDAMGEDLGYVIFDLPAPEKAHLYSKIPSSTTGNVLVAQGEHLVSNLKLYYDDNSSSTLDLEDAAIIPAAGFSGKIDLEYEAYDEDGKNKWEGTITFNVTKKTTSGVFSDVGTSYSWAADSTDFLYYEGTAQGSNGKYNPASNITRGDFMLMLYRAFLADDYDTYNVTSNFPDVIEGTSTYSKETYKAVGVAKYLNIAQGSNGKFNPTASITREEAMALIQRTMDVTKRELDYKTSTKASSFTDYNQISSWAVSAITELVEHGVIVGNNNKVNPKSNITRAEMACILHRVITY